MPFCQLKKFPSPERTDLYTEGRPVHFPLRRWAAFQHQKCTTFPSSLFTNDLFFLSKSAPQDTANRWGLKSLAVAGTPCQSTGNAQRTAGRTRKEERALSFRAAITEPAEGWHPLSTMWGVKHSLTPQGTLNKKLPSLESQRGSDGRRLGPSNENSPSEPR